MTTEYTGIWPAVVTPLDDEGKPVLSEVEKLVELFIKQELGGLYVLGSTGQGPLLSFEDRKRVAECVMGVAKGRIPVILHVGTLAADDACQLAQHAADIGTDAITAVAPYYYGPDADTVFSYYRQIAGATNLPFFAYHLSVTNTLSIGAREYIDRLLTIPNIVGMKFTDRDLFQLGLMNVYAEGKLQFLSGADEVLCHAVLSGATGAVGSFYNVFGPICQKARAVFAAGNVEAGTQFMQTFQSVIDEVLAAKAYWQFFRDALRMRSQIEIGLPRAPFGKVLGEWSEAQTEKLLKKMEAAEAYLK